MATKGKPDHIYTDEEIEFLKDHIDKLSYKNLAKEFNERYGTDISPASLVAVLNRRGIYKTVHMKPEYVGRKGSHVYTEEEREWIRKALDIYDSYGEITKHFNDHFGASVKPQSIIDQVIKVMGLRLGKNIGNFKDGERRVGKKPIGTEVVYNGYIWIKVNDIYHMGRTDSKQFRENWKPKQVYLYERAHGPLKNEQIVIFLDNDKRNFDLSNLYAIDRKIGMVMAKNRWFTESREHTLAAIKWCELYYVLHKKAAN